MGRPSRPVRSSRSRPPGRGLGPSATALGFVGALALIGHIDTVFPRSLSFLEFRRELGDDAVDVPFLDILRSVAPAFRAIPPVFAPGQASRFALGDRYRVEVRVAVWHADDVLAIPAGALFREGNFWKTYIYQNGRALLTTVEAGHSDGRFTEVLSGLEAGDKLLMHPPDTVGDGSRVRER